METIFLMEYMQSGDYYLKRRSRRHSPSKLNPLNIKLSLGIDINEAANGLFLPKSSKYVIDDAVAHTTVHTNVYYRSVYDKLVLAQPGKLREQLQNIANDLINGTFPN